MQRRGYHRRRLCESPEANARPRKYARDRLRPRSRSGWRGEDSKEIQVDDKECSSQANKDDEAKSYPWREQTRKKSGRQETGRHCGDAEAVIDEILTVPQSQVGRIVGMQGSTIQEIENSSSARVDVNVFETNQDTATRDIRIRGPSHCVEKAKALILELISDSSEEIMQIPEAMIARIIGKGGRKLQALRDESGANIDIDDSTGKVHVRGDPSSVALAVNLISEAIDAIPEKNSLEGDEEPCAEETFDVPKIMVSRIIGKGRQKLRSLQSQSGAKITAYDDGSTGKVRVVGDADSVTRAIDLISVVMDEIVDKDPILEHADAVEESIQVSRTTAGRIIGKGGTNKKKLEADNNVQIKVRNDDNGGLSSLKIQGPCEAVNHVLDVIRTVMAEQVMTSQGEHVEDVIDVPPHLMGHVCGKKGNTIMKVQADSGARVTVDRVSGKAIHIEGSPECVASAQSMIIALLSERADSFEMLGEADVVEETMDVPSNLMGHICGRGGSTIMKVQVDSGAKVNLDKTNGNAVHLKGSYECVLRARDMINTLLSEAPESSKMNGQVVEETMNVPPNLLGYICGKGGCNIMKVQIDSGAKVNADKVNGNAVYLKGSPECVMRARDMINALVAEKGDSLEARKLGIVGSLESSIVAEAEVDETMDVSPHVLGKIFGHGGSNIKRLQKESGTKIDVDKVNFNFIRFRGSRKGVDHARETIIEWVESEANPVVERMEMSQDNLRHLVGHRGQNAMSIQKESGAKISVDKVKFDSLTLTGSEVCVTRARKMIMDFVSEHGFTHERMDVPPDMLGRIYGHAGAHIMKLQDVSGARINIDKSDFKSVDLSGLSKCVAEAKNLILELFAEPGVEPGVVSPFWIKMEERLQKMGKQHQHPTQASMTKSHMEEVVQDSKPSKLKVFRPKGLSAGSRGIFNAFENDVERPKPSQVPQVRARPTQAPSPIFDPF